MEPTMRLFIALLLAAVLGPAVAAPASMVELALSSQGERMNGILYRPAADGPRPLVVVLHGMPGNERNTDIAHAARAAGYNSLFFHPRGMWGSAGTMSFANGMQDVEAALAWARDPANAARYGIDPQRVALVGHSYGGWLALQVGARQAPAVCVAGIAAWNAGLTGKRIAAGNAQEQAARIASYDGYTVGKGAMVNTSTAALMAELDAQKDAFDYLGSAPALATHPVLLVAASRDGAVSGPAAMLPLSEAMRAAGGKPTWLQFDDDHGFNTHRSELVQALVQWLQGSCFR
jgi:pimeloyl-ACP methyl ester carboxylesterase